MELLRGTINRVLIPSFMSGFTSLILAITGVIYVVTPYFYRGSYLERYGETVRSYPGGWSAGYDAILAQLDGSEGIATVSIFTFWALIGVFVYYACLAALALTVRASIFMDLLGFKGADKRSMLMTALAKFGVRLFGIVGLAVFAVFVQTVLTPLLLALVAAALSAPLYLGALYVLASIVFSMAALHVVVVLLRLIALRPRLISWMFEASDAR